MLQQYLPFTVLKLMLVDDLVSYYVVATVLTVYGIETYKLIDHVLLLLNPVATVLTVYGIETS